MPDLTLINILWMIIIFVISLSIVLIIPKIRELENGTVKTVVYIVLGLVMFSLVGFAFNMWESTSSGGQMFAKDIVVSYTEFYPMLILALAIAATVLITYMEKDNYAYFFAGTGFAVLLPDMYMYVFQNGRFDLALVGCALWAVIPVVWAFLWRGVALSRTPAWEKFITALKTAFLTYPIYLLTAVIAVFGESARVIDDGAVEVFASSIPDIIMFILWTAWLFLLFNVIIVSLMFVVHDLALKLFNYRRVAGPKGIKYEKVVPEATEVAKPKPKVNHYARLIEEMQVFSKYIGQVDRIKAASTIGRFKSEYQTLAVKYNEDSKSDAEKMIKMIELEFMQKY
jgi:hypothetical protein